MSTQSQNSYEDQEVDLSAISRKVGGFFSGIGIFIFNCIQFILRNIIIVALLFILGVGLGIYLDTVNKTYDHAIVVKPNFGSTDYLYSKIDMLNARLKERDTVFLKNIGIKNPSKFSKIQIKPIVDVYQFVNDRNERNFELLKLMAEDSDIKKIVEDETTSKNYTFHLITFSTKKFASNEGTIKPLMKFLNNSEYFRKMQKEYINNVQLKMKANESTIAQIDGFLNGLSNAGGTKGNNLVFYSENTQLNDVIETKDRLINEQGYRRIEMVSLDKIVKENNVITNIENKQSVNGKMKLILPLLFIGIFVIIRLFVNFYRAQSARSKIQQ